MTRYEVGFMNKCAEYGLSTDMAVALMQKVAERDHLAGAGEGASIGGKLGAGALGLYGTAKGIGAGIVGHGLGWPKDMVIPKSRGAQRALIRKAVRNYVKSLRSGKSKVVVPAILSALGMGATVGTLGAVGGGLGGAATGGLVGGLVGKKKKD